MIDQQRESELMIVGVAIVERDRYDGPPGLGSESHRQDLIETYASAVLAEPRKMFSEQMRRRRAERERRVHRVITEYDDPASRLTWYDSADQPQGSLDRLSGSQSHLPS